MIVDPKWLEALKLPLKVMLSIALSSGVLLLLDHIGAIDLEIFGADVRPLVLILCVVSSVLSMVGIAELLLVPLRERQKRSRLAVRRAVRQKEAEDHQAKTRAHVLARLDHLSGEEIRYVADCLRMGTPSFFTWMYHPPVSLLGGKGLIWTPGGTHPQDHYPYCFHDYVWEALLARKDEFLAKDEEREKAAEQAKRRR